MGRHLDEFLLYVGPATGQLTNLLAKEAKAQTILEVGSSYGYSTIWLAEAARETGGKVISIEIHSGKQQHARAAIQNIEPISIAKLFAHHLCWANIHSTSPFS